MNICRRSNGILIALFASDFESVFLKVRESSDPFAVAMVVISK